MTDFPTTAEVFAFAVFFVPGYLSLNIGSRLVKGKNLDLPWVEKVVLSYVWSLLVFLPVFFALGLPLNAVNVNTALTTPDALLILGSVVVFGFVSGLVYYLFLRWIDILPPAWVKNIGARMGLSAEEFYFDSTAIRFLKIIWDRRTLNELIVETQSGRMFRGKLNSKSFEPTLDILLTRPSEDLRILEFTKDKWEELDQWSILVPDGNIRSIHAIKSREKQ